MFALLFQLSGFLWGNSSSEPWNSICGPNYVKNPKIDRGGTEETGAAWSSVEPNDNIVSLRLIFGGDEDIVTANFG